MTLYFITGNEDKFAEAKQVIPSLERLEIDLPEIQSLDPQEVIRAKLIEAYKHKQGEFVVEDVSLTMECMGRLPGTFIKFFLKEWGVQRLYEEARLHDKYGAEAICMLGYAHGPDEMQFFKAVIPGRIVEPTGKGFGWDPIFIPYNTSMTYAQMGKEEKVKISHRTKAFEQLRDHVTR